MTIDRDSSSFPNGNDPRFDIFITIESILISHPIGRRSRDKDDKESEEEDSQESDEEEESEDEESDEEQTELTREQRREMKKKQTQAKQEDVDGEDDEDADLINPNHVQKKLTISDLNEPRQLTRRERFDIYA
jgi:hypothetical protein